MNQGTTETLGPSCFVRRRAVTHKGADLGKESRWEWRNQRK